MKTAVRKFPWLLFAVTWLLTFAVEQRLDAPAYWLAGGGDTSEMAQKALGGDLQRELVMLALGAIGAALLFRSRHRLKPRGAVLYLWLAYFAWCGASLLWAADPALSIRRVVALALVTLFSAGLAVDLDLELAARFLVLIPLFNLIPGIAAEIHYGNFHPFSAAHRFGGTAHPNLQGASLSLALVILSWWMWRARGRERLWAAAGAGVCGVFLLMTGSRTSMIALAIALAASGALVVVRGLTHARISRSGYLAAVAGAAVVVFAVSTALVVQPRLVNMVSAARDDGDVSELTGRTDLWQVCLGYAAERPTLGVGYDGFWSEARIDAISSELHWPINQAHSAYLDELLTLGWPGLAMYAALILFALTSCAGRFLGGDDAYGVYAALLVFALVHNTTESINVLPTFPNFAVNVAVAHLALAAPRAAFRSARRLHLAATAPAASI